MSNNVIEAGTPINITATTHVKASRGKLIGFYVNSTAGGTVVVRNGDAVGTVISGTITPAIGFHRFPAECSAGIHFTISGTINLTVFYE